MLRDIEKAMVQVLLQKCIVEEGELLALIDRLKKDFECVENVDLPAWFARVNPQLKKAGMEIRSVTTKQEVQRAIDLEEDEAPPQNVWVKYHGITNMKEDFVSKEYGSSFVEAEIKLFSEAIPIMLANGKMSIHEIEELKVAGISSSRAGETLEKLEAEAWLQREEGSGYWQLGIRSFLELKGYLEQLAVNAAPVEEGMSDDAIAKLQNEAKDALPTVLMY